MAGRLTGGNNIYSETTMTEEWTGQLEAHYGITGSMCLCLRMCFGLQPLIAWISCSRGKGEYDRAAGQN